ncbi:WD40-repeat-containing domain protein [Lobosporangium transversale]|uniref:WD40-repeat-containing domain protein n=1 Tax=Lobosporangium transversale TaxID=64571 RepID=A0A1Y2GXH7_9FUNG|nr:WD40-repeat-containing domain protein [Lobosporangium transversale]ORZ26990.1 WD40-repeat-containing domain protein [Lobosporangium transversale]|eukprot:XP_021884737.1 WD40-repeat-containing domain protein [Lobosporangium transversale]
MEGDTPEISVESNPEPSTQESSPTSELKTILQRSVKRTRELFADDQENIYAVPLEEQASQRVKLQSKIYDEFREVEILPYPLLQRQKEQLAKKKAAKGGSAGSENTGAGTDDSGVEKILDGMPKKTQQQQQSSALVKHKPTVHNPFPDAPGGSSSLVRRPVAKAVRPDWHAPWKLMRVISGHQGWVRSVAVEPGNTWFATGAGDRIIKIWDLASGRLRLSLTGHIGQVRGLAVSPRHPYLFSAGDDKMVKCWDLETNKVIRHYHGHLSGVYALALHPTLDVLVTSGRDATARVWDMRTKQAVHVLAGHTGTVSAVRCQEADPQVITSSMDSTVRLWDLAAGKTMTTLTHHKKSVRALTIHPTEFTFATASPDNIKQWKCPEGQFMRNFEGPGGVTGGGGIVNALAVNADNVMFSGADNGAMGFWDWKSGYQFQRLDSLVQPGSLESEAGIFCAEFDKTGLRLITGEADKTIKIWKEDDQATPETHPLDWKPSLVKKRY